MDHFPCSPLFLAHSDLAGVQGSILLFPQEIFKGCVGERNQILDTNPLAKSGHRGVERNVIKTPGNFNKRVLPKEH